MLGGASGVSNTVSIASSEGRWPARLMLIGLSSSAATGFIDALRGVRFDRDGRGRPASSAGAVSLAGGAPGPPPQPIDSMSFASASIRRIATPIANVTTAAATPTAPASAYKTPSLVGSRSRLW